MVRHFNTIGILTKRSDERLVHILRSLMEHLKAHQRRILLDESALAWLDEPDGCEPANTHDIARQCDLAIVVGGDGTFLMAARALADADVPLLGINIGRLGFLVDVSPHEIKSRLDEILAGEYAEDRRGMLHARVIRQGAVVAESDALNDVVLHIRDVVRMIEFDTWIDGRFVNSQRSDGIVVATPTGSTAYALSGGGPILTPSLDALVLVPICPHSLSNRPLVVHAASRVDIELSERSQPRAQVSFDGQDNVMLEPRDRVVIEQKASKLRLIHPTGYDYLQILRAKLGWGEQP